MNVQFCMELRPRKFSWFSRFCGKSNGLLYENPRRTNEKIKENPRKLQNLLRPKSHPNLSVHSADSRFLQKLGYSSTYNLFG